MTLASTLRNCVTQVSRQLVSRWMAIAPKRRATIAGCACIIPFYLFVFGPYSDRISMHARNYLAIASFLVAVLVQTWVYHRSATTLPATPLPVPELNLASEPFPRAAWLGFVPPILVAVLLWWVTTQGSDLPWRHGGSGPLANNSSYRLLVGMLIVFNSFVGLIFLFSLAVWFGMSRAYPFRRAQLLNSTANMWLALVGTTISGFGTALNVSERNLIPLVIVQLGCIVVISWNAGRMKRLYAANPRLGTWFYRDSRDPAFFGPRGFNLASGWCWILVAACLPPIVLVEWLLRGTAT